MRAYIITSGAEKKSFDQIIVRLNEHKCPYTWLRTVEDLINLKADIDPEDINLTIFNKPESSNLDVDIGDLISQIPAAAYVFCIAEKITPSDYKSITNTGRAELTDWSAAANDISHYLERQKERASSVSMPGESKDHASPLVISFIGTSGGPGNTTVAMEIGVDLALRRHAAGHKSHSGVAFLDLKAESGGVCDYLNLEPRLALKEISENPKRLDSYMLQIMASKHSSGLDVFSSVDHGLNPRSIFDLPVILSLLNCIVENYAVILIDIPSRCSIDVSEIVRNSDRVFCTGYFSVPSAKNVKEMIRYLEESGVKKQSSEVIITDTDTNLLGKISPRFNIDRVFSERKIHYVRRDRLFALESSDSGVSMVQTEPSKGICQDMQKISIHIMENTTAG